MKDFSSKVLATILAAGIVANVAIWKQFGERLARIETKLETIKPQNSVAKL